jgi:predicted nucleic acid-binding protein
LTQADRGEADLTTSDAVLAEVAFILTAKSHFRLPVSEAAASLAAVVASRGLKLNDKRSILRALDLWESHPRIGFVDALAAADAQLPGMQLATLDTDFDGIQDISSWTFADPD